MAMVLTDNQHYSDIADAIRSKNGKRISYYPSEMAKAIRSIPTESGGSSDEEDDFPVLRVPDEYREYIEYALDNLYSGNFKNLVVWDSGEWIAVSFLMNDFDITSYDPYTTEIKATGWFTCGYTKSTGEWTAHDYRNSKSPGGNYVQYIKFASCEIVCGEQKLYPVPVMTEVDVTSQVFDDEAGTLTVTLATGYVETYTYVYDDAGEVIGFTDSHGHTCTLEGIE